jgi:ribosomal subunit interface protein
MARSLHLQWESTMQTPIRITFRFPIPPTRAIHDRVTQRVDKLETYFDRIVGCHVTLDAPHQHQHQGRGHHYTVKIELEVPGKTITIARDPDKCIAREDLYSAIDDAFTSIEGALKTYAARLRDSEARPSMSH